MNQNWIVQADQNGTGIKWVVCADGPTQAMACAVYDAAQKGASVTRLERQTASTPPTYAQGQDDNK